LRFGYYESQLRRLHSDFMARWNAADESIRKNLPDFEVTSEYGGTNFVLRDQDRVLNASAIAQEAQKRGVIVEQIAPCYSNFDIGKFYFRLGVSAIPVSSIEPGIQRLAESIAVLRRQ